MSITRMEGVLEDVAARNVSTQYGEKVVYDLRLTNGPKLSAWKKELAEKAWALKGQNTYFDVEISQNGEHTNYTVKEVGEPIGMEQHAQLPSMLGSAAGGMTGFVTTTLPTTITTTASALPTVTTTAIDKDTSIHRQVAAKVAAQISTTPDEFWKNVLDLFNYFQTGQTGSLMQEIKAEENQGTQAPTNTDDIPF